MLRRLVIHDVVLIDKLALDFETGLNVFTGETGAGKSIVLDSLGLALGGRSDAGLIRTGAESASVTAEFSVQNKHPIFTILDEQGLIADGDGIILRRVINRDGKSRAFINDQAISIGLLKQIGELLLEVHGQFETHGLLNPASHQGLLDDFMGNKELRLSVAGAFNDWHKNRTALAAAEAMRKQAEAEEAFLRTSVAELDDLNLETGEEERLAVKRNLLQQSGKIIEALQSASRDLSEDHGAIESLGKAGKALARIAKQSPELQTLLDNLDRATHEVNEVSADVDKFLGSFAQDGGGLQDIEDRLFALRSAGRKHNVPVDGLIPHRDIMRAKLESLDGQGDDIKKLTQATKMAHETYKKHAHTLHEARAKSAQSLAGAIMKELAPLKLDRAQFKVDVQALPEESWNARGMDMVIFTAATNPGSPFGALQKIASGGELARFMLALKVVLTAGDSITTLVFDEVDTGIGGATASAVGERLAVLAGNVQILTVTHSPQVAARGAHHLKVSKNIKGQSTTTSVERLDKDARVEEIARMLSGNSVTDAARGAAMSLLQDAEKQIPKKKATRG